MITIKDIRDRPSLGVNKDKTLPIGKGKILIPHWNGGVEAVDARPKRPVTTRRKK